MVYIEITKQTYNQLVDMQSRFQIAEETEYNIAEVIGICMDYAEENCSVLNGDA